MLSYRATDQPNDRATERPLRHRAASILLFVVLCGALWAGGGVTASMQQPPAPSPAQEGFVPIDQLAPKEVLPAAPLVIAAYSVAWIAIFAYVVTIWKRLASVEKEMAALSQRVASGGRR